MLVIIPSYRVTTRSLNSIIDPEKLLILNVLILSLVDYSRPYSSLSQLQPKAGALHFDHWGYHYYDRLGSAPGTVGHFCAGSGMGGTVAKTISLKTERGLRHYSKQRLGIGTCRLLSTANSWLFALYRTNLDLGYSFLQCFPPQLWYMCHASNTG